MCEKPQKTLKSETFAWLSSKKLVFLYDNRSTQIIFNWDNSGLYSGRIMRVLLYLKLS